MEYITLWLANTKLLAVYHQSVLYYNALTKHKFYVLDLGVPYFSER